MRTHLCLAVLVGLAACSAVDISEELAVMEGATDKVVSNTTRALAPEVARFEREAPLRAARSGERWQLSEECILAERVTDFTSLDACEVIKRPFNDAGRDLSESEIRDAQLVDTQRKLAALQEYMDLLALLNSAKTEEDILLAYGALTGAANNLSREVGSTGVARFAEQLRERKGAAEAVTEFAVENYRARLMRQTVRRAHPAVVDLTGEVKAKLFALGIDQRYTQTYIDPVCARHYLEFFGIT